MKNILALLLLVIGCLNSQAISIRYVWDDDTLIVNVRWSIDKTYAQLGIPSNDDSLDAVAEDSGVRIEASEGLNWVLVDVYMKPALQENLHVEEANRRLLIVFVDLPHRYSENALFHTASLRDVDSVEDYHTDYVLLVWGPGIVPDTGSTLSLLGLGCVALAAVPALIRVAGQCRSR